MSLDQQSTVDALGIETITNAVVLTIIDSWDWENQDLHLAALQKKLDAYINFISSGQLLDACPKARGRRVRIDVIGRYPVPKETIGFFREVEQRYSNLDVKIAHKTLT